MKRFLLSVLLCLIVAAPSYAAKDLASEPAAGEAAAKRVLGYAIVLLVGDTSGQSMPDGLSAPAQKALADIKDFLPYKSYRLLDTAWSAGSESGATAAGRLKSPVEGQYLYFSAGFSQLNQKFQLWGDDRKVLLMDSTFTMRPGETVVVGTSRVQGDKALVVLLTISTEDIFEPGMSGVVSPVPTQIPKPVYTKAARAAGIQGTATVQCVVLTDGTCGDITVIKSLDPDDGLDGMAIENVRGWRFRPGTKDGKPVPVRVHIDIQFVLK